MQSVMKAISEDVDVQFYWTLVSQDIDNEEDAVELLTEICDMWVTVRDFSMASAWLEEYKKCKRMKIAKKRALRKDLYQKVNPPTQTESCQPTQTLMEHQEEEEELGDDQEIEAEQN